MIECPTSTAQNSLLPTLLPSCPTLTSLHLFGQKTSDPLIPLTNTLLTTLVQTFSGSLRKLSFSLIPVHVDALGVICEKFDKLETLYVTPIRDENESPPLVRTLFNPLCHLTYLLIQISLIPTLSNAQNLTTLHLHLIGSLNPPRPSPNDILPLVEACSPTLRHIGVATRVYTVC